MHKLKERLADCTLLLVEDSHVNAQVLLMQLKKRGYQKVVLAENGKQALKLTQQLHPDIVILDMMMPEMDGFEYCRHIRAMPEFASMPIIVQTGLEKQEDKIRAFTMGASDYVGKPVHGEELAARVQVHLLGKLLLEDVKERERQMLDELRASQAMQLRLFPTAEQIKTLEARYQLNISTYFESSSSLGGDYWWSQALDDHRMAIAMFDFSGHGTAAAINVFRLHTLMQELISYNMDAGQFLTRLNQQLYTLIERHEFATAFYAIINCQANSLEYASAAASPALLYQAKRKYKEWVDISGVPLGATPDTVYPTIALPFAKGDALVLFSDCYVETKNAAGKTLLAKQIAECVEQSMQAGNAEPAMHILEALLAQFRAHNHAPLRDDLTLNVYCRR